MLRTRQDRAVEGEIFGGHGLGQDAGIVFDQVKPEIVLPQLEVFTADQGGRSGHSRGLPNDEFRLAGNSGCRKISVPIHAGGFDVEVGAFPRVVLLEDVGGIGVWGVGLRDPNFKRQDSRGLGFRVCNACQFQDRRDVRLVLSAQLGHFRRRIEVVVAIGHSQAALQQVENVVVRVRKTLVHPHAEDVIGVGGESVDLSIQGCAEIGGQRRLVR